MTFYKQYLYDYITDPQALDTIPLKELAELIAIYCYTFEIKENNFQSALACAKSLIESLEHLRVHQSSLESKVEHFIKRLYETPRYYPYHNNVYGNLDLSHAYQKTPIEQRIQDAIEYLKRINCSISSGTISKASGIPQWKITEYRHLYPPTCK